MLFYPVYSLLFAGNGLSGAEVSSLFVIWSLTAFGLEVPTGLLADVVPRRRLLAVAPVLVAVGYSLWTFAPSYPSFACGFVLWGAGDALRNGTLQALVYDELQRAGAAQAYARLIGRSEAVGTTAIMAATGLASPVLAAGGFRAVGIASIAAPLLGALVGWSLPESRGRAEREEGYLAVLRAGRAEVRAEPAVRRCLLIAAVITGLGALEEYVPLLVQSTGVSLPVVPLLELMVTAGFAVGGWLAGRGTAWLAPVLAVAAGCLAVGAVSGRPAGLLLVAAAFGGFQWAGAAADARLQDRLTDRARATVTSMASVGTEAIALLTFGAYALGSTWTGPGPLFALAAAPYLLTALALRRSGPPLSE